ncbi:hypothetical protein SNEBB_010696 [Seison nebaliae]|nr:hypothetical protein SNEBB_010696 [Seison nebaliae]
MWKIILKKYPIIILSTSIIFRFYLWYGQYEQYSLINDNQVVRLWNSFRRERCAPLKQCKLAKYETSSDNRIKLEPHQFPIVKFDELFKSFELPFHHFLIIIRSDNKHLDLREFYRRILKDQKNYLTTKVDYLFYVNHRFETKQAIDIEKLIYEKNNGNNFKYSFGGSGYHKDHVNVHQDTLLISSKTTTTDINFLFEWLSNRFDNIFLEDIHKCLLHLKSTIIDEIQFTNKSNVHFFLNCIQYINGYQTLVNQLEIAPNLIAIIDEHHFPRYLEILYKLFLNIQNFDNHLSENVLCLTNESIRRDDNSTNEDTCDNFIININFIRKFLKLKQSSQSWSDIPIDMVKSDEYKLNYLSNLTTFITLDNFKDKFVELTNRIFFFLHFLLINTIVHCKSHRKRDLYGSSSFGELSTVQQCNPLASPECLMIDETNTQPGTIFCNLTDGTQDPDIVFIIRSPSEYFTIQSQRLLVWKKAVDYEILNNTKLTIPLTKLSKKSNERVEFETYVCINDHNDNMPLFPKSLNFNKRRISINESAPINTLVGRYVVCDPDRSYTEKNDFKLHFVSDSHFKLLDEGKYDKEVESCKKCYCKLSEIYLHSKLDYEKSKVHRVHIGVAHSGEEQFSFNQNNLDNKRNLKKRYNNRRYSSFNRNYRKLGRKKTEQTTRQITITVEVLDANDAPPKFVNLPNHIEISENAKLMEQLFQVEAKDGDDDVIDKHLINYRLVDVSVSQDNWNSKNNNNNNNNDYHRSKFYKINTDILVHEYFRLTDQGELFLLQKLDMENELFQHGLIRLTIMAEELDCYDENKHESSIVNIDRIYTNSKCKSFENLFIQIKDDNDNLPTITADRNIVKINTCLRQTSNLDVEIRVEDKDKTSANANMTITVNDTRFDVSPKSLLQSGYVKLSIRNETLFNLQFDNENDSIAIEVAVNEFVEINKERKRRSNFLPLIVKLEKTDHLPELRLPQSGISVYDPRKDSYQNEKEFLTKKYHRKFDPVADQNSIFIKRKKNFIQIFLYENVSPGTKLLKFHANDADNDSMHFEIRGVNTYRLHGHENDRMIEPKFVLTYSNNTMYDGYWNEKMATYHQKGSSEVYLRLLSELDAELKAFHTLTLIIRDQTLRQTNIEIDIYVMDVNDNAPIIVNPENIYLKENSQKCVGKVVLQDSDISYPNDQLSWSLVSSSSLSTIFNLEFTHQQNNINDLSSLIDVHEAMPLIERSKSSCQSNNLLLGRKKLTACLRPNRTFDFEKLPLRDKFELIITVRDCGSPPKESLVHINMIIEDENDNKPIILPYLPPSNPILEEFLRNVLTQFNENIDNDLIQKQILNYEKFLHKHFKGNQIENTNNKNDTKQIIISTENHEILSRTIPESVNNNVTLEVFIKGNITAGEILFTIFAIDLDRSFDYGQSSLIYDLNCKLRFDADDDEASKIDVMDSETSILADINPFSIDFVHGHIRTYYQLISNATYDCLIIVKDNHNQTGNVTQETEQKLIIQTETVNTGSAATVILKKEKCKNKVKTIIIPPMMFGLGFGLGMCCCCRSKRRSKKKKKKSEKREKNLENKISENSSCENNQIDDGKFSRFMHIIRKPFNGMLPIMNGVGGSVFKKMRSKNHNKLSRDDSSKLNKLDEKERTLTSIISFPSTTLSPNNFEHEKDMIHLPNVPIGFENFNNLIQSSCSGESSPSSAGDAESRWQRGAHLKNMYPDNRADPMRPICSLGPLQISHELEKMHRLSNEKDHYLEPNIRNYDQTPYSPKDLTSSSSSTSSFDKKNKKKNDKSKFQLPAILALKSNVRSSRLKLLKNDKKKNNKENKRNSMKRSVSESSSQLTISKTFHKQQQMANHQTNSRTGNISVINPSNHLMNQQQIHMDRNEMNNQSNKEHKFCTLQHPQSCHRSVVRSNATKTLEKPSCYRSSKHIHLNDNTLRRSHQSSDTIQRAYLKLNTISHQQQQQHQQHIIPSLNKPSNNDSSYINTNYQRVAFNNPNENGKNDYLQSNAHHHHQHPPQHIYSDINSESNSFTNSNHMNNQSHHQTNVITFKDYSKYVSNV